MAKLLKMRADLEKGRRRTPATAWTTTGKVSTSEPDDEDGSDDGDEDEGKDGGDCGKTAEPETAKREFSQDRREDLADAGHALPDGSYPIPDADALRRAAVLARSGHGDVAAARRLITRRAGELGVPNPLDDDDKVKKSASEGDCATCDGSGKIMEGNRDCPDCGPGETKAAEPEAAKVKKPKVPCPGCKAKVKASAKFCPGCGGKMATPDTAKASKPTPGDGVTGEHTEPVPAHREPDGPAIEDLEHDAGLPTSPDRDIEAKAARRRAASGADPGEAVLHDLLCPAFSAKALGEAYPWLPDVRDAVDVAYWRGKAIDTAAGSPSPSPRPTPRCGSTPKHSRARTRATSPRSTASCTRRSRTPIPARAHSPPQASSAPAVSGGRT